MRLRWVQPSSHGLPPSHERSTVAVKAKRRRLLQQGASTSPPAEPVAEVISLVPGQQKPTQTQRPPIPRQARVMLWKARRLDRPKLAPSIPPHRGSRLRHVPVSSERKVFANVKDATIVVFRTIGNLGGMV